LLIKLSAYNNGKFNTEIIDKPFVNSNNKVKIAILGIIVNQIVTWVGDSS
jgi:hypothetical protein